MKILANSEGNVTALPVITQILQSAGLPTVISCCEHNGATHRSERYSDDKCLHFQLALNCCGTSPQSN